MKNSAVKSFDSTLQEFACFKWELRESSEKSHQKLHQKAAANPLVKNP